MSARNRYAVAISAGLLAQYFLLVPAGFDTSWGHSSSFNFWISPFRVLLNFIPGLIAGLLSVRYGMVTGALAVWLAEVIRHFIGFDYPGSGAYIPLTGEFSWFTVSRDPLDGLAAVLWLSLSNAFIGAVSGGAGQLLRSNTSLERMRAR